MRSICLTFALLTAALLCILFMPSPAAAQTAPGAVLIWPVNPVIEADRAAGALWLENPGKTPVTLQVRIYSWAQAEGKNLYADQQTVVGTPPILTIAPGGKQLVRITRMGPLPEGYEVPYRIIIDEIPVEIGTVPAPGAAVAFRMRYSLPLFVLGRSAPAKSSKAPPAMPALGWRIVGTGSERMIEVRNSGAIHARLTDAAAGSTSLASGLLGYVLAGETMRWPLPAGVSNHVGLTASINGAPTAPVSRAPD